ncbi:MAG: YabP/YqfC family sporulation protein [Clostridia bacterium]
MFNFFDEIKKEFKLVEDEFSGFCMINLSNKLIYVEGHRGMLGFSSEKITFKTKQSVLEITGTNLMLKMLSSTTLCVQGDIIFAKVV